VSPSTQNQAINALVLLYKHVLKQPLDKEINAERATKRLKIPVIYTHILLQQGGQGVMSPWMISARFCGIVLVSDLRGL
jgi:hypothetical protein